MVDSQYHTDFDSFLESPAHIQEARRKKAREARNLQIKAYKLWARELGDGGGVTRPSLDGGGRKVAFSAEDRLRDATTRSDHNEGRLVAGS